jgi:phosphoenolpyruvate carboxykinase (ATP)
MNIIFNIKTPAEKEAKELASRFGVSNHGLRNLRKVYWNLPEPALYEEIIFRSEGKIAYKGPIIVHTGKHTGRAANDKFIVREPSSEEHVWWGEYNRPLPPEQFSKLYARVQAYLQQRDIFVQDCYVGAHPESRLPIRIITEYAWHSLFARNMFLPIQSLEEYKNHVPEFTIISAPNLNSLPEIDATHSTTFIVLNFAQKVGIIGGTSYGGEIKKSIFTVMNYLLPLQGILSMHCSANVGKDGDVALFFGLSGTGKTSLSADPKRRLIGDDEHGWNDDGVFNFENGCYAKVIRLSPEHEPQIYAATRRFGAIIENVVFDPVTRKIDYDDDYITENTRASYPLEFIENVVPEKMAGHPKFIIFLTCDANGVMPPVARLNPAQAMYQFISGYTSKLSGTEIGLGLEPEATFSTCFGAPFMVHHPIVYAKLLEQKMKKHNVQCWLVNTGWTGGPFGVGKRISIGHTRRILDAIFSGELQKVKFRKDPIFGFEVPTQCEGVPASLLNPEESWPDRQAYWNKYRELATLFIENFKKFKSQCPPEVIEAGPKL